MGETKSCYTFLFDGRYWCAVPTPRDVMRLSLYSSRRPVHDPCVYSRGVWVLRSNTTDCQRQGVVVSLYASFRRHLPLTGS